MNITTRIKRRLNLNSKVIGLMIVLFIAVITGIAIADKKWIYLGLVFIPLILYLCIEKPFIFPLGLYVFLLPFDSILSISGSSYGGTLTKLLGAMSILVFAIKGALENKLKKPNVALIWWILFFLCGVSSATWAIKPSYVISILPTALSLLLLYLVAACYQFKKNELEILKMLILFGGLLAAIVSIYNYQMGIFIKENIQRTTMMVGDRAANANHFMFALIIPISIGIEMLLKQSKKTLKGLIGVVVGVILLGVIFTGSRGGMLGIGVIFIVYIVSMKQKMTLLTVLVIIGIVLSSLLPSVFIERWQVSIEGGGSGRTSIWYVGLMCLGKYWPIGAGLNNFRFAYNDFAYYAPTFEGMSRGAHNIFLGYFVELGVIGITLMALAMRQHYKLIQSRLTQYNIDKIMLRASFWGILTHSFFLDTLYLKSFWLLWMMIMMHITVQSTSKYICNSASHQNTIT